MRVQNLFFEALSLKHTFDNKVFFWSDLHLRHARDFVYGPRGFKDEKDAEHTIIHRWNEKITNNDVVFLLGDTVFGQDGEQYLEGLFKRLPFKELYMAFGNHHSGIKQVFNKNYENTRETSLSISPNKIVHFIPNYFEVYVNGQPIVMSHYSIIGWNGYSKGSILLHGHNHNNLKQDLGKSLDVGVERCPYPQSFSEIMTFMKTKEIIGFDHHTKDDLNPFG